jgi:hypothetical protein
LNPLAMDKFRTLWLKPGLEWCQKRRTANNYYEL